MFHVQWKNQRHDPTDCIQRSGRRKETVGPCLYFKLCLLHRSLPCSTMTFRCKPEIVSGFSYRKKGNVSNVSLCYPKPRLYLCESGTSRQDFLCHYSACQIVIALVLISYNFLCILIHMLWVLPSWRA